MRLDGLHAHARKAAAIDPDGPAKERSPLIDGVELDDVAVETVDLLRAGQPVAIVVAEAELERQRQDLLGLQQRKRRPVLGAEPRSVHRERQLFPLDAVGRREVAVFRDDVVAGVGDGGPEVLLHPRVRVIVIDGGVLRGLLLPMPRDDLLDRQLTRGAGPPLRDASDLAVASALKSISIGLPVRGASIRTVAPSR